MASDNQDARIILLEAALKEGIAYLKRLPRVPTTIELIASLEATLAERPPATRQYGARHSAAGVTIIEVDVIDDKAIIHTGSPEEKADRLWQILSEGVVVPLTHQRR